MLKTQVEIFCPTSRTAWRKWLRQNHLSKPSVWLVYYKQKSGLPSISWGEAVEEALCFGWIDSKRIPLDDDKFMQFFSKRKPRGTWSRINKEKIGQLIAGGLMTKAGYESIEKAKQNGSWTILDDVEKLKIPRDLEAAFKIKKGSKKFFLSLSKSVRKAHLQSIVLAKRAETKQKRINDIAGVTDKKLKEEHS